VLSLFVKSDVILKFSSKLTQIPTDKNSQCDDGVLFVGDKTKELLQNMVNKGQKEQVTEFYIQVRKFYQTFASKLLGYLPLKNAFLRTVRVLEPKNFADMTLETSLILLSDLCRLFPTILDDCTKDSISREWRTLKLKEISKEDLDLSAVQFWKSRKNDFPNLWTLVTAALSIPHGNASTERVFSTLHDMLSNKRANLGDLTINSTLHVKSALAYKKDTCESVFIDDNMVVAARNAYHTYKMRLQMQRKEQEEKEAEAKRMEALKKCLYAKEKAMIATTTVNEKEAKIKSKRKALDDKESHLKNLLVEYQKGLDKLHKDRKEIEKEEVEVSKKKAKISQMALSFSKDTFHVI